MKNVILITALLVAPPLTLADDDVELAQQMVNLQYFAHKAALAIDAKNQPLADFYVHEFEETLEDTAKIESYDGYPVGKLVNSMLVPALDNLESALKRGNWNKISRAFDGVINSCNACHRATEHGFIHIERQKDNPFLQSFETESER